MATEVNLPAGKVLARQGEVGRELFILLDGTASVTRDGQRVAARTAGDVVGELAVISHRPRNATVVAETELRTLVLTHAGLDQLLDDIPGLAKHLLYEVSARLETATPDVAALKRRSMAIPSAPGRHYQPLTIPLVPYSGGGSETL